jgi:demethoxyubiquinone hydroxylase (CLK1/Coq7/Cat5 family)
MSNLIKYGKTPNGVQKFLNKETGLIIQEKKVRPSIMFKLFVVFMTLNGATRHRMSKVAGVSPTAVYKWCKLYDEKVRMNYDITHNFTDDITEIEVDELYHKFTDGGNIEKIMIYYDKNGNIIHQKVEKRHKDYMF